MKTLNITLFGSPQFTIYSSPDKSVIGFISNKARALLIYLAVTKRAHSRDVLSELLWADTPTTKRENLKKVLSNLRRMDGITLLEEGRHQVALDPQSCWLDVADFSRIASNETSPDSTTWQQAVELYHDDFLSGFNLSLSLEFEEWALSEQTRLKMQMVDLLRRLADQYTQQHNPTKAITTLRRLVKIEPWQEDAHRQLIKVLAQNNSMAAALAHFERCKEDLRQELDVEPSPATLALIAQIRDGTFRTNNPIPAKAIKQPPKPFRQKQTKTAVEFPLVGREHEWQLVSDRWQKLNNSHLLCIGGEAGIGKTRLAEELLLRAELEGIAAARTRSHELQGQLAYGPITDWLRLPPLRRALDQLDDVWRTEVARLLPELLIDGLSAPQPMTEGWQRKRFFDALVHTVTSVDGPLLLLLDDLQWSDTDTLEWIQYLIESSEQPILIAGTVRLNEIDPDHPLHRVRQQLQRQDKFTQIALAPLSAAATNQLGAAVTEHSLADELADRLYRDTAGNPLFVIESMRTGPTVQISDEAIFSPYPQPEVDNPLPMPTKMYSVIQSRLAQLSPQAQKLAQIGATIGRAFDVTLLATAAESDEDVVLMILDELWQHRIIKEVDAVHFDFSHDRIRDVAYAEIGPIKRRVLHRSVAEALEVLYERKIESIAAHVAMHYEIARSFQQAIGFYQKAAHEAERLYAYHDTVKHLERAVHLLRRQPASSDAKQLEIDLLLAVSEARTVAEGKGVPAIYGDLHAADSLVQDFGTPGQNIRVLTSLAKHARVCGEWHKAAELGAQALAAIEEVGTPERLLYARYADATPHIRLGDLERAHLQLEQIPFDLIMKESKQINVGLLTRSAYLLWLLGFPDQARERALAAVDITHKDSHEGITIALHQCSSIHVFCKEIAQVDELSQELVDLTKKRGDDFSLRWGLIYRGWLLVQEGKLDEGIAMMRENADEHRARNNYFYECVWRSLLAEAYLAVGEIDAARKEIGETLAYAERSCDVHWNAQLLKQKGDCLRASGAPVAVVADQYQLAIDIARKQNSRSLELRASTNLCRLWQEHGKVAEAYQLLLQIYGWFTEGFDTADLVEARTLLDELRQLVLA